MGLGWFLYRWDDGKGRYGVSIRVMGSSSEGYLDFGQALIDKSFSTEVLV